MLPNFSTEATNSTENRQIILLIRKILTSEFLLFHYTFYFYSTMKFASSCFLLIVGTVVGSTDAFLPTSQIAVRQQIINDDAFALYMKQSKNRHAEYQNGQPDVRLHQSSTSYDASATCAQSVLLIPTATTSTAASSSNPLAKALLQQPSLLVKALASSTLFIFSDILIKQIFKAKGIGFPSSLAGCCAMAATLLVNPFHASMYQVLAPGAKLLQKFLMVFLVPNLIVLPMCDGCGSVTDVSPIQQQHYSIDGKNPYRQIIIEQCLYNNATSSSFPFFLFRWPRSFPLSLEGSSFPCYPPRTRYVLSASSLEVPVRTTLPHR